MSVGEIRESVNAAAAHIEQAPTSMPGDVYNIGLIRQEEAVDPIAVMRQQTGACIGTIINVLAPEYGRFSDEMLNAREIFQRLLAGDDNPNVYLQAAAQHTNSALIENKKASEIMLTLGIKGKEMIDVLGRFATLHRQYVDLHSELAARTDNAVGARHRAHESAVRYLDGV